MSALAYDPAVDLRHFPATMRRFGENQYGQPLYRIVFAPSRRYLVCGTWPDGSTGGRYMRKYSQLGEIWIMERWLPAEEYAKCSRAEWDTNLSILGPWPERGDYDLCHSFETSGPADANLEKLVAWIEEGRRRSYFEKQTFARDSYAQERKDIGNLQEAMIRNWLPAFGAAPMSGYGGGRSQKAAPIIKTAEELGLPTQGGMLRTKNPVNQPVFEIPLDTR